jgi:hypothetical protein
VRCITRPLQDELRRVLLVFLDERRDRRGCSEALHVQIREPNIHTKLPQSASGDHFGNMDRPGIWLPWKRSDERSGKEREEKMTEPLERIFGNTTTEFCFG